MKETTLTNNKKCVIYCRVSTKEQVDEGNSLVSQERICREYAEKQGYEIAQIFIEKGESAKTANRPELNKLLGFCTAKKGNINAVVSYKVDRISRNIADYSFIRVKLKKYGVEIKSVTEFFEDTPAGRFMENIIANVGQFDNDVRTERCIGGMREAVNEGRYVWMAPMGYDNVKINSKSTIAPNALAPLMKETFERIAERRESTEAIRLLMTQKGLLSKKGLPICCSNFFRLLRNPLYKGIINKFGVNVKGAFDPIVSEELFQDVQLALAGRKNKVKQYLHENPDFPLRRFVRNEQGKQLTGYWSKGKYKRYPYYSFHLPGTTIRKELLEEKFMAFLEMYEFDSKHLNTMRHYLKEFFEKKVDTIAQERQLIEKRVEDINGQIDKLIELQSSGAISLSILTERTRKFEYELEHLKELLKNREIKEYDIPSVLAFAVKVLKQPHMLWRKSPFVIKKKLQVFDFPEGVVFNGQKFRTPKECNVFKLKSEFAHVSTQLVNSKLPGKNTASGIKKPPIENNFYQSKAFWEKVLEELIQLQKIMKNEPEPVEEVHDEEWSWSNC